MRRDDDLVLVAIFALPSEAAVAASLLESEGIDTLVDQPFVSGVRPDWIFGRERDDDGVRLHVRHDDADRAREILAAMPDEPLSDESDTSA